MGIVDEDIARVRDSTDLVSLIGEQVTLKRQGQRYVGLCPFHQEKTPSFGVNPTMGIYKCFGCGVSGDAITWVRETEHLDFPEAVERLAQRAGITLRYDDRSQAKDRSRSARLSEAVGAAIDFYHRLLLEAPEGGAARAYLRGRGFDGDAARRFVLGWAPEGWDGLSRWLQQERRFAREDVVGAGLAFVNKANRLQDQFRSRLMFPIHDARGEPAGFGGRSLTDDGPKYKNSPETPIYQKSRLLYGLQWAKAEIVAKGDVVICEGYTDVMAFALAGAPNAVATCGTALSDDHVKALKNLARKVTLAYDTDAAGQAAAEQWYRWEHEYELTVRVADLPAGRDPGDLWRDDQPRLLAAIEHAKPFLRFRIDRALGAADLSTHEGRGRAAEIAAGIIGGHPSELVRDQYVMELAGRLDIEADSLRSEVARGMQRSTRSERSRETDEVSSLQREPESRGSAAERELLRIALHEPEMVPGWVTPDMFADRQNRKIFAALLGSSTVEAAIGMIPAELHDDFRSLCVEQPILGLEDAEREETSILRHGRVPQIDELRAVLARARRLEVDPLVRKRRLVADFASGIVADRANTVVQRMVQRSDFRASDVKQLIGKLDLARASSDFEACTDLAQQLIGWIIEEARASAPEVVEQGV